MKRLVIALLVSVAAHACSENNPEVFQTFRLSWPAQAGAVEYEIHYGENQNFPAGNLLAVDLNFLIPGLTYAFNTYWIGSEGTRHHFGPEVFYTAPGYGFIGIGQNGAVRMRVEPDKRIRLQAADSLSSPMSWTTLYDKVWTINGVFEFRDPVIRPMRFYRTIAN